MSASCLWCRVAADGVPVLRGQVNLSRAGLRGHIARVPGQVRTRTQEVWGRDAFLPQKPEGDDLWDYDATVAGTYLLNVVWPDSQ